MKYVDEFRDPDRMQRLIAAIRESATRTWVIMEVCGGQTHGLVRSGIEAELSGIVELVHGPGCPVCVTPQEAIDFAQELALRDGVILTTFGDMLRVPGSRHSLLDVRSRGGQVKPVYCPLDAVALAERNPDLQVVFFAVGFETTAPATALAVLQAARLKLSNFSMLVSHVRVLPAMEMLMATPDNRVQGFLAAGHVCTITGYAAYEDFAKTHQVPVVVTGFEPLDLLEGIHDCINLLESSRIAVTNRYSRIVRRIGNSSAQDLIGQVYEVSDCPWRGFGIIPNGGFRIRPEYGRFDAEERFGRDASPKPPELRINLCQAADVLAGRLRPLECPEFGIRCTPDSPLGTPMVSSEGACAAYYPLYQPSEETIPGGTAR